MGAWGVGIFEDDVACDVRDLFERVVTTHNDVEAATHTVLHEFADVIEDLDDGAVVYLALATLQIEHGVLQPSIRASVLNIITSGQDLLRWENADDVSERRRVLEELQKHILAL
jgi:hypothetical protein